MDFQLLEISLISAQGLKPPSGPRRLQSYAVAWVDPAAKLRTRVDRTGGENPTWNDKFIFRVPLAFLDADSPSAVSVEIYADGSWCLPDSLVGSVRLLLANHRLLDRPRDRPSFIALGIRRPSGCFRGVLNIAATLLTRVSLLAAEALAGSPAVGYQDLMGEGSRIPRKAAPTEAAAAKQITAGPAGESERDSALKERNREEVRGIGDGTGEEGSDGVGVLCGLGFSGRSI